MGFQGCEEDPFEKRSTEAGGGLRGRGGGVSWTFYGLSASSSIATTPQSKLPQYRDNVKLRLLQFQAQIIIVGLKNLIS